MARDYASKYIISFGTQRTDMSLYFAVITIDVIVVFGANRMRNITQCIQTTVKSQVSVQVQV